MTVSLSIGRKIGEKWRRSKEGKGKGLKQELEYRIQKSEVRDQRSEVRGSKGKAQK